ncbi:hypothetical protein H7170_00075 [Candidatus Gracilibacteria bacterium]|nr:hypothetical protein [Candidatus Gracilibacteria bacterium]
MLSRVIDIVGEFTNPHTMIIRYSLIAALLTLSSCSYGVSTPTQPVVTPPVATGTVVQPPPTNIATGSTDEYRLSFTNTNTGMVTVHHTTGVKTHVYFVNTDAKTAHVVVTFPAGTQGNLRWSQVVMPDGTMDGPFGQDTNYNLAQTGSYELIFHENMMSGDPWTGDAWIMITLQK